MFSNYIMTGEGTKAMAHLRYPNNFMNDILSGTMCARVYRVRQDAGGLN